MIKINRYKIYNLFESNVTNNFFNVEKIKCYKESPIKNNNPNISVVIDGKGKIKIGNKTKKIKK